MFTNLVRPRGTSAIMTFKQITIGSRVSAPRGPFLQLDDGKKRKRRAISFGVVIQSTDNNEWVVRYDDGRELREKSTQLKLHPTSAGRLPVTGALIHCITAPKYSQNV